MGERGRLADHIDRPKCQGLSNPLLVSVAGENDDGQLRVASPDTGQRREASQLRHYKVEEYPVDGGGLEQVESLHGVEANQGLVAVSADRLGNDLGHGGFVINDKNSHLFGRFVGRFVGRFEYPDRPLSR